MTSWSGLGGCRFFPCPVTAFEHSRPAADATREALGAVIQVANEPGASSVPFKQAAPAATC
jgi:hypothetical protein